MVKKRRPVYSLLKGIDARVNAIKCLGAKEHALAEEVKVGKQNTNKRGKGAQATRALL
jgi:hypothetical protein